MSTNSILATTPLVTTNYLLRATGTTIGNSLIWDNGTNVGIGNTNTTYKLDVSGTGNFTGALSGTSATFSGALTFASGGANYLYGGSLRVLFSNGTNTNNIYSGGVNGLRVINQADTTALLTIADTGAATFSSGIGIGGATATTGGIQFPATQVSIADANNLDDYEEGTWTIGLTFGGAAVGLTTGNNGGKYTKIGRQVTVTGYISLSNKGSSTGSASITGLPFTIFNNTPNYSSATTWLGQITFANMFMSIAVINTTQIDLFEMTEAGVRANITNSDFANNSDIVLSLTYFTT